MNRTPIIAALALAACAKETPMMTPPPPAVDAGIDMTTAAAIRGLEWWTIEGCAACHCNAAEGGCNLDAPGVQGVDFDALVANLRYATTADEDPDKNDPWDTHPYKNRMATDAQLRDLELFLGTLSGKTKIDNQTQIGRGYELYVTGTCIQCHLMSAQGVNQGGIGQAIAGIDPDNIYLALAGGVQCHPLQNRVPTSSTGQPLPVCSILDRYITDNRTVARLTDTAPPGVDIERAHLSYFLSFISPPPSGGIIEPCENRAGEICSFMGNGVGGFNGDGKSASRSQVYFPQNLDFVDWNKDGSTDLAVVDWNNHRIRIVYLDKTIDGVLNPTVTIAGDGKVTGLDALNHPTDVAFDRDKNLVIATWHNQNIYRYPNGRPPGVDRDQVFGLCDIKCPPDDGPNNGAVTALGLPVGVEVLPDGSYLVSENQCGRIRKITVVGTASIAQPLNCVEPVQLFTMSRVETIAGQNLMYGYEGDGMPARMGKLNPNPGPGLANFGISLDKSSPPRRLYIADTRNNVIRFLDLMAGTLGTLAGGPGMAGFVDGPAATARFNFPTAVYAHTDGSVYVADARNHAIRRVAPDGTVTTVAGTGRAGFTRDNVRATEAPLNYPNGVIVHADGRIFISDTNNNRIRVVKP